MATSPLAQLAAPQEPEPQAAPQAAPQPDPIAAFMEENKKNRSMLDAQIERLKSGLDQRTQYPFNPMYMRLAADFAKPTKTGSFAESAGNAASGLMDYYDKEHAKNLDIEKQKFELMKLQQAAAQQDANQKFLMTFAGGKGEGPMLVGAKQEGLTAPSGAAAAGEKPPMINGQLAKPITEKDLVAIGSIDPKMADFLKGISKHRRDMLMETKEGIYDTSSNTWLIKFDQKPEPFTLPIIGDKTVTAAQRKKVESILEKADASGWDADKRDSELAKYYESQGWIRGEKTPEGKTKILLQTPEEKQSEQELIKGRQTNKIKAEEGLISGWQKNAETADALKQVADSNIHLATNPDTKRVFGLLSKPGVLKGFQQLLAEGIRTPNGSYQVPGIEKWVLQNLPQGTTEKEIAAYQIAIQNMAQLAITFRNVFKGQGAVSNYEGQLAARLGPEVSDTPMTMVLKSEMLKQRARFDQAVNNEYYKWAEKNPSKFAQDYQRSDEYKRLVKHNDEYMKGLLHQFFPSSVSHQPHGSLESQIR